jgi:hypothetical protein
MTTEFLMWWAAGLVVSALVLRFFYARNPRFGRICFWVLLGIFLTPVGAVILYVVLAVLNKQSGAPVPAHAPVIEK